jgi:hypothetical protein
VLDVVTVELLYQMVESKNIKSATGLIDLSKAVMDGEENIEDILKRITDRQQRS